MRPFIACLLFSVAIPARADQIVLKGGRSLIGEIVERTATNVTIEIGPGRVTLPLTAVDHIVSGPSALSTYRERAQRLATGDAAGWLALGCWARDRALATQANAAFERVIAIDPSNEQAQQALGRFRVGDQWMTREESYRAQGLLPFEGDWITPQERDGRLAQRQIEAERQRAESETRLREAEARARQAEAEARRAEAEAAAVSQPSVPLIPVWVGAGLPERRERDRHERAHPLHDRHPTPTPQPSLIPHTESPPPRPRPTPTPAPPPAGAIRRGPSPN